MLWNNVKAKIEIVKVDNGMVLDWELGPKPKRVRSFAMPDDEAVFGRRGMEIFTDEKKLFKRIAELLAIPATGS